MLLVRLPHAHAVVVILVLNDFVALRLTLQLASRFPGVCPAAISGQIANGVIGQRIRTVSNQLVLPRAVIGVACRIRRTAQGSGGVSIPLLAEHVAAPVILVDPCGAAAACGCVCGIVHAGKLAEGVIAHLHRRPSRRVRNLVHAGNALKRKRGGNQLSAGNLLYICHSPDLTEPEELSLLRHSG